MKRITIYLLFCAALVVLYRCAQIVPLSGGTRDRTPPKLLKAQPLNYSTGFTSKKIVLEFDEFVQVRDLANQLVVSPRLSTEPVVSAEGRSIIVEFGTDSLAPNTTYRLAFGKAIADMHESNPAENFEFVFSTGNAIDTLKFEGLTIDALTQRPQRDISVCLYRKAPLDSLPYKVVPDYIARTDEMGRFRFSHLPETSFEVIAFSDNNKNNLYDGETEKVGFLSKTLELKKDTSETVFLFQENPSKTFIKKTVTPFYGFVQIILNKKTRVNVRTLKPLDSKNISEIRPQEQKDTVSVFYRTITDSLKLIVDAEGFQKADTLNIVLPRNNRTKRVMGTYLTNAPSALLPYDNKLLLRFNIWMDTTRFENARATMTSKKDSISIKDTLKGRWLDINTFEVGNKLTEGMDYTLKTDTAVFFDVFGSTIDSVKNNFKVQPKVELGKAILKVSLIKKGNYVIQLINEQLHTVRQQPLAFSLSSSNTATIEFDNLKPGTYQVRIVSDLNANEKWDIGNVLKRVQPEPIEINSKLLKVLADWEIEEEIVQRISEGKDRK